MNPLHKGTKDLISVIITLVKYISGGDTFFYGRLKQTDLGIWAYVLKHVNGKIIMISIWNMFPWMFTLGMTQRTNIFCYLKKMVHLFCLGYRFYNQCINSTIRTKYLDDNGTVVKPKELFSKVLTGKMCRHGINIYSSRG